MVRNLKTKFSVSKHLKSQLRPPVSNEKVHVCDVFAYFCPWSVATPVSDKKCLSVTFLFINR